ncbi:hypothetical protein ACSBR2_008115 [Camellia fascicularis]
MLSRFRGRFAERAAGGGRDTEDAKLLIEQQKELQSLVTDIQIRNPPTTFTHLPLPAQGHVNSMLKLAELLYLSDFYVTFLVSDYTHDRLFRYTDVHKHFEHYPKFRFQTFCDGIPTKSAQSGNDFLTELIVSLKTVIKPFFR